MTLPETAVADPREHSPWSSRRLWSVWDMINFMIPHYQAMLKFVYQELSIAQANMLGVGDAAIEEHHKGRIKQNFSFLHKKSIEYGLETVTTRVERILTLCRPADIFTRSEVVRQMTTLLEAFEDDTKIRYLYIYPEAAKGVLFGSCCCRLGRHGQSIPRAQSRYRSWSRLLRTRPSTALRVLHDACDGSWRQLVKN